MTDEFDGPPEPPPSETLAGRHTSVARAMEWGIELAGQLAEIHRGDVVCGNVAADTIGLDDDGSPLLADPDSRAVNNKWEDIRDLAEVVRGLVPEPPPELIETLRSPYATAVALGEELQDAQRALDLPVTPIPFEPISVRVASGSLLDVPAFSREPRTPPDLAPAVDSDADVDANRAVPNPWVLLAVAVVVLAIAVVVGVGWG